MRLVRYPAPEVSCYRPPARVLYIICEFDIGEFDGDGGCKFAGDAMIARYFEQGVERTTTCQRGGLIRILGRSKQIQQD